MRKRISFSRRVAHLTPALALIMLVASVCISYRVRAAEEAAQFVPANTKSVLLPALTAIQALVRNRIAASAGPGDTVTAYVSLPVVFDGTSVIPSGAQLKGNLEELSVIGATSQATASFTVLLIGGRVVTIQTRRVVLITPVETDTEILATAFRTLLGASIGAAIGAASGDLRLLKSGLVEGTGPSVSVEMAVPITLILIREVEV